MTDPASPLTPVEPPLTVASDGEAWDHAIEQTPSWPVTRLVGASLTLALCLALLLPVALLRAHDLTRFVLVAPALVATLGARAVFESRASARRRASVAGQLLSALPAGALALLLMAGAATVIGIAFSPLAWTLSGVLGVIVLVIAGEARTLEIRVRLSLRRVYFIGARSSQQDLARELSRRDDAQLVGAASVEGPADRRQLLDTIRAARATVLVLDRTAMQSPELVEAASELNLAGLHVRDLTSYYESEFKKVPLAELTPTWFLFDIASIHQRISSRAVRRGLEMIVSATLLALGAPALALAAIAIKLTSPGPVIYRQQRAGRGGEPFTLIKLRTMGPAAGPEAQWASGELRRTTAVGRFLRRFRLDELPQLWSVLKGDMALIGPRPEQLPIAARLERDLRHYSARHCIRPGITGWAQVNLGYAGSVEGTVAKLQRDLYYVKHSSLRLDGLILWLTIRTVISGRG